MTEQCCQLNDGVFCHVWLHLSDIYDLTKQEINSNIIMVTLIFVWYVSITVTLSVILLPIAKNSHYAYHPSCPPPQTLQKAYLSLIPLLCAFDLSDFSDTLSLRSLWSLIWAIWSSFATSKPFSLFVRIKYYTRGYSWVYVLSQSKAMPKYTMVTIRLQRLFSLYQKTILPSLFW